MTKAKWERELEDWGQGFGNMFGGFLGMFCVIAIVMFFYEGCNYQGEKIVVEKEESDSNAITYESDWTWLLFK